MKKLNLDIQMFSSTNKTTNYELPQFIGTDKPTWLGDFNEAMAGIDAGMHANASDIDTLESSVATASATASQASQDVASLTSTVNTLSTDVSSAVSTANNAQSTATSALNTANTANGKADTNATAITGLDTRVTALEGATDIYSSDEVLTNEIWQNKQVYRKTYTSPSGITSATDIDLSSFLPANADEFWIDTTHSFQRVNINADNFTGDLPIPQYRSQNNYVDLIPNIRTKKLKVEVGTGSYCHGVINVTIKYTKSSS